MPVIKCIVVARLTDWPAGKIPVFLLISISGRGAGRLWPYVDRLAQPDGERWYCAVGQPIGQMWRDDNTEMKSRDLGLI
jgi:hypothetical protein